MKVSKKSEYGVRALIEIARHHGSGWRQISHIAEATGIPDKFLEQILLALKNRGILQSRRGADGGYAFARAPSDVTLNDVVTALDGGESPDTEPTDAGGEIFREIAASAESAYRGVLTGHTLDGLAEEAARRGRPAPGSLEYQI